MEGGSKRDNRSQKDAVSELGMSCGLRICRCCSVESDGIIETAGGEKKLKQEEFEVFRR